MSSLDDQRFECRHFRAKFRLGLETAYDGVAIIDHGLVTPSTHILPDVRERHVSILAQKIDEHGTDMCQIFWLEIGTEHSVGNVEVFANHSCDYRGPDFKFRSCTRVDWNGRHHWRSRMFARQTRFDCLDLFVEITIALARSGHVASAIAYPRSVLVVQHGSDFV